VAIARDVGDSVLYHSLFESASPQQVSRSLTGDGNHALNWMAAAKCNSAEVRTDDKRDFLESRRYADGDNAPERLMTKQKPGFHKLITFGLLLRWSPGEWILLARSGFSKPQYALHL
jgi:hypothetical protein